MAEVLLLAFGVLAAAAIGFFAGVSHGRTREALEAHDTPSTAYQQAWVRYREAWDRYLSMVTDDHEAECPMRPTTTEDM